MKISDQAKKQIQSIRNQTEKKMSDIIYEYQQATGEMPPKFDIDKESIESAFLKMLEIIKQDEEYVENFWNELFEKYSFDFIAQVMVFPVSFRENLPRIPSRFERCIHFSMGLLDNQLAIYNKRPNDVLKHERYELIPDPAPKRRPVVWFMPQKLSYIKM